MKEELPESTNIEEFGQNEFFGGKAEGFEESSSCSKISQVSLHKLYISLKTCLMGSM